MYYLNITIVRMIVLASVFRSSVKGSSLSKNLSIYLCTFQTRSAYFHPKKFIYPFPKIFPQFPSNHRRQLSSTNGTNRFGEWGNRTLYIPAFSPPTFLDPSAVNYDLPDQNRETGANRKVFGQSAGDVAPLLPGCLGGVTLPIIFTWPAPGFATFRRKSPGGMVSGICFPFLLGADKQRRLLNGATK